MNPAFIDIKEFPQRMQEYKEQQGMDFLRELIGMDWGEEGLGVIYILENSTTHQNIEVAIKTTDRKYPALPTVCHLWSVAELYEREVYDFFGIHFTDHPDMRRLFLRNDWVGYPLRKDYDESEAINPVRMESEITEDVQREYEIKEEAEIKELNQKTNKISGDQYIINIGPQHPATHGVLRFRLALEGEEIRKIDIHC